MSCVPQETVEGDVCLDDDSEGELDDEIAKHFTAFNGRCESDKDSCDDDVSYDEFADSYKKLYAKSETSTIFYLFLHKQILGA